VLSEAKVKTHVKRMLSKPAVNSRARAVVVAHESGLVVADTRGTPSAGRIAFPGCPRLFF
jgi:hypothetical protein